MFSEDGELYIVDVMAPRGEPKVLRVDVSDGSAEQVHTDDRGVFTSAQFGDDGRLYLTDMLGSAIRSVAADGDASVVVGWAAVDVDGIIYQMFHNRTAIEVFGHDGTYLTMIDIPDDAHELSSATNIAIEPGTTNGVV